MSSINNIEDSNNVPDLKKEKNNFLSAYHTLKFSKKDKDSFEVADVERISLALKYATAKLFESEEAAAVLLRKDLEDYHTLMKDKSGVNNYWKQIKSQLPDTKNDPLKWKSGLDDVDNALNFIKSLPCQETNTLSCKRKSYNDGDIEKLISISKKRKYVSPERNIEIPLKSQASTSQFQEISSLKRNEQIELANISSSYRSKSFNKYGNYTDVNMPKLQSNTHSRSYQNLDNYVQNVYSPLNSNDISKVTNSSNKSLNQLPPKLKPTATATSQSNDKVRSASIKNSTNNVTSSFNKSSNPFSSKLKPTATTTSQGNDQVKDGKAQTNAIESAFRSARDELIIQEMKSGRGVPKKTLGGRGAANTQFVCPFKRDKERSTESHNSAKQNGTNNTEEVEDERLRNIDQNMIELIRNEIMDSGKSVTWDDIAGLDYTKKIIKEVVVFPMLRPDIFTGLRRPPKGILLFGPPGTGKTLIGKCIASQSKSTFFTISASSLTSKWIGEGEKMVRALFAVARVHQPSVVFIDEIDSLLTQRSETEHESSRRLKTEFLVQLDGAATSDEDRILIVGATNRPQELDEAARRRLVKRLYVPLPELRAREQIINNLLASERHNLTPEEVKRIAECSAGYSGADMANLCKEASMGPIRSIPFSQLEDIRMEEVRHITSRDFEEALINVRPSVSQSDLNVYIEWDRTYGSGTAQTCKA